ncbi:hypothetical protein DOY81_007945 [Sarcophaga bullata]|nr:hypothetical protein DOY81_007945 [Sarcophaga bullata]
MTIPKKRGVYAVFKKNAGVIRFQILSSMMEQKLIYYLSETVSDVQLGNRLSNVKTDMLPGRAFSRLYIANANREEPAAMQHASGSTMNPILSVVLFVVFVVVLCQR